MASATFFSTMALMSAAASSPSDSLSIQSLLEGLSPAAIAAAVVTAAVLVVTLVAIVFSGGSKGGQGRSSSAAAADDSVALHPEEWRKFQLIEKTKLSPNVFRFRFALQTPTTVLGLPIGQHISLQGKEEDGKEFMRSYTPTSLDCDVGHVDFVIKLYPDGAMSKYLAKLEEGNFISMRGPKGRFRYQPNTIRAIGMIGGGSGITPMYQVTRAILESSSDSTRVHLISANVSEDDILLRQEIDGFASAHPDQFSVYYVLNKPPQGWKGGEGFVTKDIINAHLPAPAPDVRILYCGPPPMNKAMAAALEELGYTADMLFKF